ncbi:hypothetical protein [Sinisalibacter lacisalsi]|uniref:Pentapeptide repeat-containing protein n=1 Tax=Sinisalibacter lacisalsi TaxID=1526570 RepID=A0ABQ1QP46_9RHOB|nr:hypothetical protein [Sinisalibacter lacisalsi]GGD34435.1 hypothetical protein GCM10011358_18110 [Sinisalibacter lacisalsi]
MSQIPDLTPDCDACAALCCMALAFDAGEDFAIDKPAGLPCPNLEADLGCALYTRLEDAGFSGCARYDCHGAGQRVTQELFDGRDWRAEPALAKPMISAFANMRKVHDGIELLLAAGRLDLPAPLEEEREDLLEAYARPDWTENSLAAFPASDAPARLAAFLPRLRDWV